MINPPINPPTHPDEDGAAEADRIFLYTISEDLTHYCFLGECEDLQELTEQMCELVKRGQEGDGPLAHFPKQGSKSISPMHHLYWYPGDKCTIDGLPYPHDPDKPPYEGFSIARDADGNEFTEECDL